MTMEPITESGMTFGPYPAGQCFYIEKSKCYAAVQEGVQMAEFPMKVHQPLSPEDLGAFAGWQDWKLWAQP